VATNFADSGQYTDAQMNMRKRLAEAMIKNGMETTPIQSHWQGLARLANALIGGYSAHKLGEEDKKQQAEAASWGADLLSPTSGASPGSGSIASPKPATSTFSEPPAAVAPSARKTKAFAPEIDAAIEKHARATGIDPGYLRAAVDIESGGDPNNVTGSYIGLGQLSKEEFAKYGGKGDIRDPDENLRVFAVKTAAERDDFKRRHGRDPSPVEIYLAHQQGQGGLDAHLKNPDAPAWQNMASTAEGREKGPRWAKLAIWGNVPDKDKARFGSVDNMTSKDFMDIWAGRVNRGLGGSATKMALGGPAAAPAEAAAADPIQTPPEVDPAATPAEKPVQVAQAPATTMTDAPATAVTPLAPAAQPVAPRAAPQPVAEQPPVDSAMLRGIQQGLRSPNPAIRARAQKLNDALMAKRLAGEQLNPLQRAQVPKEQAEAELKQRELARADITDEKALSEVRKLEAETEKAQLDVAGKKREVKEQAIDDRYKLQDAISSIDSSWRAANEVKNHPGLDDIAGRPFGGEMKIRGIGVDVADLTPGTSQADAFNAHKNLVAKAALTTMERLKQQSKAGATGFGALNQKELELIENSIANLKLSSSKEELVKGYDKFQEALMGARERLIERYKGKYGNVDVGVPSKQALFDGAAVDGMNEKPTQYTRPRTVTIPGLDIGLQIPFTKTRPEPSAAPQAAPQAAPIMQAPETPDERRQRLLKSLMQQSDRRT